jgi:hypothetical protein
LGYEHLKIAKSISLENAKQKYVLFVDNTCYCDYVNDELSVSCYWTNRFDEGLKYLMEIIDNPLYENHKERLNKNHEYFISKMS